VLESLGLYTEKEEKKVMAFATKDFQSLIDCLLSERNSKGRNIYADIVELSNYYGWELRLWDKNTDKILITRIAYAAVLNDTAFKIIRKAFDTPPFTIPSKLEQVLK
jgi:hypothetical protein